MVILRAGQFLNCFFYTFAKSKVLITCAYIFQVYLLEEICAGAYFCFVLEKSLKHNILPLFIFENKTWCGGNAEATLRDAKVNKKHTKKSGRKILGWQLLLAADARHCQLKGDFSSFFRALHLQSVHRFPRRYTHPARCDVITCCSPPWCVYPIRTFMRCVCDA